MAREEMHPLPIKTIRHKRRVIRWLSFFAALLLIVGVAINSSSAITRWLGGLFGPPRVEMKEAYSDHAVGESGVAPSFDHSAFDALLHQYVDADGWIDYHGLKTEDARLDEYLSAVAAAPFDALGRDEKLALLINAYNAFTLKLIVEHLPVKSIKDISSAERWDAVRWNVGGHVWSLNQIEHEQIRPKFIEPRVHFVLVCAAVGCPPLRNEAYDPARLEQQLDEQTRYVHQQATWFQFDARTNALRLTELYNWYGGDFEQVAGSAAEFAARYSPELKQALESGSSPSIKWLAYDWNLNSLANKQPR